MKKGAAHPKYYLEQQLSQCSTIMNHTTVRVTVFTIITPVNNNSWEGLDSSHVANDNDNDNNNIIMILLCGVQCSVGLSIFHTLNFFSSRPNRLPGYSTALAG